MSVDFRRARRHEGSINLTPLIDVIFQLLVFFMLTSSFSYPALPLDLPDAEAVAEEREAQTFVLSMDREDRLYLNREPVDFDSLEAALRQAFAGRASPVVYFRGDREIAYHRFVALMQAVGRAGAGGFYLIHEQEEGR